MLTLRNAVAARWRSAGAGALPVRGGKSVGERFAGLSYRISRVVRALSCLGLLAMSVIIVWQVFARYVLNASPAWAEQAALLLLVWYVLFAAAAGVREGFHIRIAAFVDNLPPRPRRIALVSAHVIVAAFGIALAVWGWELMMATWAHVIPTLALPRGVAYLPMPLSGILIFAFSVEHVVAVLKGREVRPAWS